MKSIVISSNSSGGGKTTISVGIMKALMKKGFDVQGYKVGPDYIDPAFHSKITGKPSRNLDIYLMEEEGIKASYSRGKGELGVVEGVMGLYDGKGIDSKYSTAHVAKTLELPVVLVLSPKAQSATLCAEINGLMN
ncbi:cobyrinate a,c-diamide synthase, partial [Bacteroidales bacterium MSK.15.36]|nr:cobyrinate a,c-diamide synthase [Bacteroidales bacterium MSK.15.36]